MPIVVLHMCYLLCQAGTYEANQCLLPVSQEKGGVLKLFFSSFSFTEDLISLCWCQFGYTKSIREPLVTVCPLQLFSLRGQLLDVAHPSLGSGSCSAAVSWTGQRQSPCPGSSKSEAPVAMGLCLWGTQGGCTACPLVGLHGQSHQLSSLFWDLMSCQLQLGSSAGSAGMGCLAFLLWC